MESTVSTDPSIKKLQTKNLASNLIINVKLIYYVFSEGIILLYINILYIIYLQYISTN